MENISISDIVNKYVGCTYYVNTKIVSFEYDDYITTQSMVGLLDILNKHNVPFRVLDELNIQILDY